MDQTKIVVYLAYAIIAIILVVGLFPLFDAVTSIFIILFLFAFAMTLLYFGNVFLRKKSWDFDE